MNNNNNNNFKPHEFNRNINYIKELLIIQFKIIKEYKINVIYSFISGSLYTLIYLFFLTIFNLNFGHIINWGINEFFYFVIITSSIKIISWIFRGNLNLKLTLIKGQMNNLLVKPINIKLQYFLNSASLSYGAHFIIYFLILIIFLINIFDKIAFLRIIISIAFSLYGIFGVLSVFYFIDSFAFFIKENSFILKNYFSIYSLFDIYPAQLFQNWIKNIIWIFPSVYFGAYSTQFLFNHISYLELFKLFIYQNILIIICVIGIYINWKIGLKKYEAFG